MRRGGWCGRRWMGRRSDSTDLTRAAAIGLRLTPLAWRILQEDDEAAEVGVRGEVLGLLPFASLQQTDTEGDLEPIEANQITFVSRDDVAALVNLQHDLIDCPCESVKILGVALAAPVEEPGDPEPAAGGESPAQVAEEDGVGFQMAGVGIEVDLKTGDAVARLAPAGEIGQHLCVEARRPVECFDTDYHPDFSVADVGNCRALGDKRRLAGPYFGVQQIDGAGVRQRRLRHHSRPEPEGVVTAGLHDGGLCAGNAGSAY